MLFEVGLGGRRCLIRGASDVRTDGVLRVGVVVVRHLRVSIGIIMGKL